MDAIFRIFSLKTTISLLWVLVLTGCFESDRKTNQLCENNPRLCNDLNTGDAQCQNERTDLIWGRLRVQKKSSDLHKFDELLLTKKYAKCMESAAQIETTTLKSKKTRRTEALYSALDSIERIENALKLSYQPSIIYYRWSQGDKDAMAQFLKLEETEYLNTSELQLALATYYVNKDKSHTITLLLKSLTFYDGKAVNTRKKIIPEAIKTLATSHHALGNVDAAYLWALIGRKLGLPIATDARLKFLYPMSDKKRHQIAAKANRIAKSIEKGKFDKTMLNAITSE